MSEEHPSVHAAIMAIRCAAESLTALPDTDKAQKLATRSAEWAIVATILREQIGEKHMKQDETWRWIEATEEWIRESEVVALGVKFAKRSRTERETQRRAITNAANREARKRVERSICQKLHPATVDEMRVVEMFVDKVMGEGRREYGPLDLATDTRTVAELLRDAVDERMDSEFYLLVAALRDAGL